MGSNAVKNVTVKIKDQTAKVTITQALPVRLAYTSEVYSGDYTIVPKFKDQVLKTQNKTMSDDLTVKEITVSRVSNDAGGKTVWIGEV